MAMQYLRDRHYAIIGSTDTDRRGVQVAGDKYMSRLGQYDPHEDITRDRHMNRIGTGNQLASLVLAARA